MAAGDMGRQVTMATIVIALLLLIIITPSLLGDRQADIASLPQVLVDRVGEETKIYVSGAFSSYRYTRIRIDVREPSSWERIEAVNESDVYSSRLVLPGESGARFALWVLVEAGDVEFEFNATVEVLTEAHAEVPAELLVEAHMWDDQTPWQDKAPYAHFIPRREVP